MVDNHTDRQCICPGCAGTGIVVRTPIEPFSPARVGPFHYTCNICNGAGSVSEKKALEAMKTYRPYQE